MSVTLAVAAVLLTLSAPPLATTHEQIATPGQVLVEIRSYNLKTGTRDKFHELFVRVTLPMLQRRKVDVVAYGPSVHDRDSYFLMRAFSSLDARQRSEDAFYSSAEWLSGPRAAVLDAIESYTTIIIGVDDATLGGLRRIMQTHSATI
jgi:hypothetical protein